MATIRALVLGTVLGLVGAVLGAFVGANVGGNFTPDWEFAGTRGYEATGLVGAWIGGAGLAALGVFWGRERRSRVNPAR